MTPDLDTGGKRKRGRAIITEAEHLSRSVEVGGPAECWLWTGRTNHKGYGTVRLLHRTVPAHRMAYRNWVGPIPEGHQIDHLCGVRACCNPAHLEAVTPQENNRRSNSPSAVNARKTHCIRGHELAGDNLIIQPSGKRNCRVCSTASVKQYQERVRKSRPAAQCGNHRPNPSNVEKQA